MGTSGNSRVPTCQPRCQGVPTLADRESPRTKKPRFMRGFFQCAEEDSNLHPVIPDQALNLARLPIPPSARGRSEYSPGRPAPPHPAARGSDACWTCVRPQVALPSRTHVRSTRGAPGRMDIGKALGLASSSTVHAHLANLEKVGLLRRDPSKPRAIELLDKAVETAKAAVSIGPSGLPLVGQVAAGQPILAEENIEEYVDVPALAGGDDGEYVLRVRGDSMIDAGILEGDFVVVRPQDTAADGEIVVALVGEEATVKRFFRETDHIRLQPENRTMEPIRTTEARVIGRVVGLFRSVA